MSSRLLGQLILLGTLGKFLLTPSALAFTLGSGFLSTDRGWPTGNITFNVNYANCPLSQAQMDAAIDAAISVWNGVPTSGLKLVKGISSSTPAQITGGTAPDSPVLFCDPNFSTDIGMDGNLVPGAGRAFPSNGNINYGYFILNAESGKRANIANIDSHYLPIVIAHEMGHVLGLGHSSDKSSLMYYDGTLKQQLALSQDDMDGITYLYPRTEVGGDKILGCSSMQTMNSSRKSPKGNWPSGGAGAELLGLFLFAALVINRSKLINPARPSN